MSGTSSRRHKLGALGVVAAAAGAIALTLAVAAPVSAHIKIDGTGTAVVGTTAPITFRVPTESDTATTVGVTVTFPKDTPFGSVQPQFKPGWDVKVTTADLPSPVKDSTGKQLTSYVQSVTWTATAGGIPSELYDTFTVRAGAVPDTDSIALPALQTYSDGSTVNWAEIAEGSAVPQHPAPVLTVLPATSNSTASPSATPKPDAGSTSTGGDASLGLGIGGLAAGVIGLIVAIVALARGRKTPAGQSA